MSKKYFVIDNKNGDRFESKPFEQVENAIKEANYQWNHLTDHDKKLRLEFVVAECETDEDGLIDYSAGYDVIKDYLAK